MAESSYTGNELQVVVFRLGREEYAVSILQVQEIKRMAGVTRVPHTPEYIKGVINLRGSVLPVIDLAKRLGLSEQEYTNDTRIIIVKVDDIAAGMIVDQVLEVTTISTDNIDEPSTVAGGVSTSYISGVGKLDNRLLILLNLEEIIGIVNADNKAG